MIRITERFRNKVLEFDRAEIYYAGGLKNAIPFADGTTAIPPNGLAPLTNFVRVYDKDNVFEEISCSDSFIRDVIMLIFEEPKRTYGEWYHEIYWRMRNGHTPGGGGTGAFDMLVNGLFAKKEGLPLHKLLGAKRDKAHVYASGVGTRLTIEQVKAEVERYISEGFDAFKMKIGSDYGRDMARDVERIKFVRDLIGPKRTLAIDANQAWTVDETLRFADMVIKYNIDWIEEPILCYDVNGFGRLARECPITVSTGEQMFGTELFESFIAAGVKHLQLFGSRAPSLASWLHIADLADKNGVRLSSGGVSQISCAFIAASNENNITEWLLPRRRELKEYYKPSPRYENSYWHLPQEPGLPCRMNIEKLRADGYLKKVETIFSKH